MQRNNPYIAEILKARVSEVELEAALQDADHRGIDVLDVLEEAGHDKAALFAVIADHFGMEAISLSGTEPPPSAARLLDPETATRYHVVPIRKQGTTLSLAFGNPMDIETIDTLRYLFKEPIELLAALPEQVSAALGRLYPEVDQGMETILNMMGDEETKTFEKEDVAVSIEADADEPIIKLVNLLILEGFKQRASDIHLEPRREMGRMRFRIDGVLHHVYELPSAVNAAT